MPGVAVQCDRGRAGGSHTGGMVHPGDGRCVAWASPAEAGSAQCGRTGVIVPGPTEVGPWDSDRVSRSRAVGTGRSRNPVPWSNVRGATGGPAEAGPGVAVRRSWSCVRSRPRGGPGSPCLGAYGGQRAPAPNGVHGPPPPRGRWGGGPTDASHGGPPEGGPALRGPVRLSYPAEAGIGWPRRALHGSGGNGPWRAVRAQSSGGADASLRASACQPVQRPDPQPGGVSGRSRARPGRGPGRCRTGTRTIVGNTEAFPPINAFFPTLLSAVIGGYSPPATATPGKALAGINNLCPAFHVETRSAGPKAHIN